MGASIPQTEVGAREGITPSVSRAVAMFAARIAAVDGTRILRTVVFDSRARVDATAESDVKVAVLLDRVDDPRAERDGLSDVFYDVIIAILEEIQACAVSMAEWENPTLARNPVLICAMKHDGIDVKTIR